MNWRDYEKEIYKYFKEGYPGAEIKYDQKVIGKYSKVERQIDILIEGNLAGYNLKIIVDCKSFAKRIDVKGVESFSAMVEDVEAHQGVLITNKGFSKAAINRAYYGPQKVELDILNFDEIQKFQSFIALPYVGNSGVILFAPFGWVIDIKDKPNSFASLFQRGLSFKQAEDRNEWMYVNFWKINYDKFEIDHLIEHQNSNLLQIDPSAKIEYRSDINRKDGHKTKIRIAEIKSYPSIEVTGFIQFESFVFFVVLHTPKELLNKNLRKLQFVLATAVPTSIEFKNKEVIDKLLMNIDETESVQEKAEMHYKVGSRYHEMKDFNNALINYRKAVDYFPTHYSFLKQIIYYELHFGNIENVLRYSSQLFELKPKNSIIPQFLMKIFFEESKGRTIETYLKRGKILESFIKEKINNQSEFEVLGDLHFYLGILKINLGLVQKNNNLKRDGIENLKIAKLNFKRVFKADHQVFVTINKVIKEMEGKLEDSL